MTRTLLALACVLAAGGAAAQPAGVTASPWQTFVRGGALHQFDADLDADGSYSVTRANVELGVAYAFGPRDSVGLAFGYGLDDYSFDGDAGLAGLDPWGTINEYQISAPLRMGLGERFDAFALPSLRWTAESGGDLGEAMTGGLLAGVSYTVNDRLRIGPGLGVFGEIEDDVSIFPILLIDWQITDTISLDTGPGIAATRGPGLTLNYTGLEGWTLGLGARYEKYRFRLDDGGAAPDGVGEEEGIPVYLAASYDIIPRVRLSAFAGVEVANEVTLDDADGNEITSEDADPAPFLGVTFRARF